MIRSPNANGFVERFSRILLDEFFRRKMRESCCEIVEVLQADLDTWLGHYNTERPPLGCRNHGRRPIGTVMSLDGQEAGVNARQSSSDKIPCSF